MASTYSNCVRRLSNFLRNQDFVAPSGDTQSAIANLYEAIMLEQGDFGAKGTINFPAANREISDRSSVNFGHCRKTSAMCSF